LPADDEDDDDDDDEESEEGQLRWEDDYEWDGEHPSFEDKVVLLRRAAKGHPRDTFAWVLDVAKPRHYDDDEDRDEWVKAVQRTREEGVLQAELAQFLIWKIVMNAHEYRQNTVDPVLVELADREEEVAKKYGVEAEDVHLKVYAPVEWAEIDKAWEAREAEMIREVFVAAGETALEVEMRERAEEFAARMKGWEERVGREEAVRRRASPGGGSASSGKSYRLRQRPRPAEE
jgi:hypothetical protein